jgi:hypothetical protein
MDDVSDCHDEGVDDDDEFVGRLHIVMSLGATGENALKKVEHLIATAGVLLAPARQKREEHVDSR